MQTIQFAKCFLKIWERTLVLKFKGAEYFYLYVFIEVSAVKLFVAFHFHVIGNKRVWIMASF